MYFCAGITALKDVSVVVPPAARIMDTVTLQCDYDLEGEPLYTFKWYKGGREFYRFIPKELPNTQVFPLPGISVDLTKTTPNKLVLKNLQAEATGRYKCEVSSDAPNFYTCMQSGYMYVIDVPDENPVMIMEKDLDMGQTVKGNCSAPPSYPAANITWYLNGKKSYWSYSGTKRKQPDSGIHQLFKSRLVESNLCETVESEGNVDRDDKSKKRAAEDILEKARNRASKASRFLGSSKN
ncbi:hypothetical protein JTB14_020623 [Gonioctena quinquepunctata]|nr:hypothetical protein JTB14_020623 [Gonioctena quinquepunctata]